MNVDEALDPLHKPHWDKFKLIIKNNKLAQALLFISSASLKTEKLVHHLITFLLCQAPASEPCLHCSDCLMMMHNEHPDVLSISAEKTGTAIKIEQIRFLQEEIYQKPQRGKGRFVIIDAAENMNRAAANALLKILEEPPEHSRFILMAEHLATLPATLLSRCQLWRINPEHSDRHFRLLDPKEAISPEIENQYLFIVQDLLSLLKGELIPSSLALNWKAIPLKTLLDLLYRIYAQILMINTLPEINSDIDSMIKTIAEMTKPQKIFYQLDKIKALQRKLIHNIHVNNVLAIEDLLMDLCQGEAYVG